MKRREDEPWELGTPFFILRTTLLLKIK